MDNMVEDYVMMFWTFALPPLLLLALAAVMYLASRAERKRRADEPRYGTFTHWPPPES